MAAFAGVGGGLALLLGWGRLGADVGAVLTLGVGAAAGALAAADTGPGRARAAAILAVPAIAVGLLAVLDLVTGGDSHFTRSVLRAGGLRELGEVAQRRFELSYTRSGAAQSGRWWSWRWPRWPPASTGATGSWPRSAANGGWWRASGPPLPPS